MPRPKEPRTPAEWQEAADLAQACLALDAARQYGLVTGGPGVRVDRCEALLARAADRGIFPTEAGVGAAVRAIATDE